VKPLRHDANNLALLSIYHDGLANYKAVAAELATPVTIGQYGGPLW